jgi:hypothetical protein
VETLSWWVSKQMMKDVRASIGILSNGVVRQPARLIKIAGRDRNYGRTLIKVLILVS